jgi:rhodanese-related sulfurtransferase
MAAEIKYLSVDEVVSKRTADPTLLVLDVRMEPEWEAYHIPGATLIPMNELLDRISELDPNRETIVVCEHGIRSENVARYLVTALSFTDVATMEGGMSEWPGPVEHGS